MIKANCFYWNYQNVRLHRARWRTFTHFASHHPLLHQPHFQTPLTCSTDTTQLHTAPRVLQPHFQRPLTRQAHITQLPTPPPSLAAATRFLATTLSNASHAPDQHATTHYTSTISRSSHQGSCSHISQPSLTALDVLLKQTTILDRIQINIKCSQPNRHSASWRSTVTTLLCLPHV